MNLSPRDNFYRCMTLIVDNGNEAAWELLDFYLSNQGTTLKDFIENNQHEIYHLCYNYSRCCRCQYAIVNKPKSRILYQTQLDILLDTKGSNIPCHVYVHAKPSCTHRINDHYANPNIATNQLDLTLCRCLLINFTNILPHGSVERTAFEDLINMRNKCCHAAKGEISSKDYQTYKTQIENCLLALAQIYGKTHDMTLKIKDAEKRPFDESICKQLQQTILQEQVLQGVSGLHKHIESSQESEERMTIEIQELGKRTKRTFRAVNSSLKSAGHTASKIQKLAESTKRTLMVVKSSKKSVDHTATKVQKQNENTERTLQAVECSQKSIEHTAAKIQKLEENTQETLQAVEYTAASIEKKLEESSKRTKQVLELNHKSVEHTSAKLAKKMEENSERTIKAVESSQESTSTKIQKFEERLSKCETSKRSRLLGLTQTEINGHLKEGTFVETPAVQACIKLLETNSLLVLTGAAGTGKSRNSLEILHQFQIKHPEYETIKLTDLHDFTDIVTTEEKLVILFEDIFGRTNTRFAENTDVQIIDRIHACTIKGNIKTILTVRDTIRLSCDWLFTSHKIFHGKCEIDLSSKTFKITKPEKELLLLKYFFAHNFRLLEFNEQENYFEEKILDRQVTATVNRVTLHSIVETEPLLGFPEACSLFTGNRKLTRLGLSFFKHPSKYLYEEIEKLRINGSDNRQDSMTYVTLVYIFLNEDSLDPEDIDGEKCLEILESCYGISCKKIPTCQIIDAANGMLGRYLIFHFVNGTYHFQHQTIFESILISYSRIDTGLILSRLSFDFIREMVRLQNYKPREGEIVLKIIQKHYSMLANRIMEIIQSEYFSRSFSLHFHLLCESQIIRENDEYFLKILIEKAHDAYFEQDYNLQKFVTYSGECKRCQLYLPALLLERITQQNKMDKSIALLVDHLALKLDSESEEDIEFSCKSSLLEAFLHVCELENNENILDNIWVPLKRFDTSKIKENIRSSINRLCSRCPITTIKWIVKNTDISTFDINHILNTACEFKRLDVVQFLCTTVIGEKGNGVSIHDNIFLHELDKSQGKGTAVNQLDFTAAFIAAINNVWNDRDEPVSKWLIKNVPHQLFDMKRITMKVLEMKCMEDLKFLIQNVDNCMLDMKLVYTNQHKEGSKSIENLLRWMAANVEQQKIDILELNNLPCMTQDTEVVKYLFKNFDHSILDWTSLLLSAVNSNWRGKSKDLVEWLVLNIDLKCVNFTKVIKEVDETNEDVTKMMLEKVNHASLDMKQIMNQSCRFGWLDVVTWMLHNIDHAILDIKEAMNRVPDLCGLINVQEIRGDKYNSLFKLFLEKVNHGLLDMKEIINRACRYYWLDVVTLVLDKKENHAMFDVRETINILYDECDLEYDKNKNNENNDDVYNIRNECKHLIKLFLEKVNQNLMDMKEILNRACRYGWLDVVKWVLENTNHKQLDIKEAMHIVYSSKVYDIYDNEDIKDRRDQYEPFIKLILEKVNHALLDLNDVLNQACRYCSLDVVTLVLEKNDHKKLDVKEALYIVYSLWKYDNDDEEEDEYINDRRDKYETLFKLILEKVNHDSLVLKEIFNQACQYGLLGVVKLVLKNAEHKMLDLKKAINIVYSSWMHDNDDEKEDEDIHDRRDKYEPLIKLILEKVNSDSPDLILVFNQACRYGCLDVVTLMLENNDHKTLNIMEAVNIIYSSIRDDDDDISDQRKKYEPLIKLILDKVNHDSLDFKVIMNKACRYCFLGVFTYVLENNDYDKLEIMEAVNILYGRIWNEDGDVDDIDVQREKYEPLIKLILGKVNHDLLDIKEIMNKACSYGCIDVVTFVLENIDLKECDMIESINIVSNPPCLNNMNHDSIVLKIMCKACCYGYLDVVMFALENTDHKRLDIMEAVNIVYSSASDDDYDDGDMNGQRGKHESLVRQILEKVNHDLLDLKTVFFQAFCRRYLDVVTFLLENTDHDKLGVKEAMNTAFGHINYFSLRIRMYDKRGTHEPLIKLMLDKVNKDSLPLKRIINYACRYGYLDIVKYLLENTDHKKLDIMEAVKHAHSHFWNEDHINERRKQNEHLIKLILEKVDHDLLVLKDIMYEACRYGYLDVVTFLLENTDHKKLDIMEAVNNAYSQFSDKVDINEQRKKQEPLIKLILEKADHDSLVLKDVVTFLLENTDQKTVDIIEALNKACNPSIDEDTADNICENDSNKNLVKMLLQKAKTDLLDVEILMNEACRKDWLNIVSWLVENIAHSIFDIDTAMNVLLLHNTENNLAIFKLLLENISQNLFNIGSVIEQAVRLNHTEKVLWILQTKDNSLFDIKYVMNEACRNSNLLLIKYVMENMDKKCFDARSAMNKACRSSKTNSLEVVKLLLENIPHNMLNLESAMNNACRYDNVVVVQWFWSNLDRKLFNVKTAWNNACYNCNKALLSYLLYNIDENMLDKSKALSQVCRNIKEGNKVISLLFEQPNVNTPENCKLVLTEACVHCNRNVVKWLLSYTDIQPLVYKESLIDTIKATIDMTNNREKSDRVSIVQFLLEHDSIRKLRQNDMSEVMEAVSSIGQLQLVQRLWHNTEQSMFNMRAIVNKACESGQFEIVDWLLQNIELENLDVRTVMVESCGYGWLKIVKLLWSKFEIENFDIRTSMDEACSYSRYEIVKYLLENVDSKLLDTRLILEKACGNGWKDITLWLFGNIDSRFIDLKTCMFEACAQGRLEIVELFLSKYGPNNFDVNILVDISCKNSGNAGVIQFLIENFDLKQSDIDIIIKNACKYGWREIVKSILDRCDHNKNLLEEAMKNACINGETEIVKIFLDKIDISFLEVKTNMIISCQKGWEEIVSLLLERVNHSLFDLTGAMNDACRRGEADIVELLIQKVDHKFFNFKKAIMEACKSHLNENLVLTLLNDINQPTSDRDGMSKKAREYGWRKVSSRLKRMSCNEN